MYGLPKNIDLNFLKGIQLIQICISFNHVIMRFDNDVTISVESVFKLFTDEGEVRFHSENISINTDFINLLGETIIGLEAYESGTLVLYFENGSKVELYDDSKKYESYEIRGNGRTITV